MNVKIRNRKNFYSGLLFIFFGVLCAGIAVTYPMGKSSRMGPGYFPSILGGILAILGFVVAVQALWIKGEEIKPYALRPLVLVLGAVVAFALLADPFGLLLATLTLVVISRLGGGEFRIREVAVIFLVLAALGVVLFVYGLGLPFKVWP